MHKKAHYTEGRQKQLFIYLNAVCMYVRMWIREVQCFKFIFPIAKLIIVPEPEDKMMPFDAFHAFEYTVFVKPREVLWAMWWCSAIHNRKNAHDMYKELWNYMSCIVELVITMQRYCHRLCDKNQALKPIIREHVSKFLAIGTIFTGKRRKKTTVQLTNRKLISLKMVVAQLIRNHVPCMKTEHLTSRLQDVATAFLGIWNHWTSTNLALF